MSQPDHKYIFCLRNGDGRSAVVIEESKDAAKQRAHFSCGNHLNSWEDARVSILSRVRRSMMNRIVAMED